MTMLSETHTNVKTLTTNLQFPVSDWDEKWMDMYLDNSVKLLDICNALTSELSRLDQSQLLLKYGMHILASAGTSPSSEELKRVHSSLHDWMEKIHSRSPKLEKCSSILQELTGTLHLVKVKNSAKGKVLVRALHGVKAVTIFICSVFTAALSGCSEPLMDLNVSGEFLWADAFNDLKAGLNGEIRNLFSLGKSGALKEVEAVNARVKKLHNASIGLGQMNEEQPTNDTNNNEEVPTSRKNNGQEQKGWKESCSDLANSAECFAQELDLLSKQLEEFFHLVLAGRNAMLFSLTSPDVQLKAKADKFR